jgi:hypothetical protein
MSEYSKAEVAQAFKSKLDAYRLGYQDGRANRARSAVGPHAQYYIGGFNHGSTDRDMFARAAWLESQKETT